MRPIGQLPPRRSYSSRRLYLCVGSEVDGPQTSNARVLLGVIVLPLVAACLFGAVLYIVVSEVEQEPLQRRAVGIEEASQRGEVGIVEPRTGQIDQTARKVDPEHTPREDRQPPSRRR